MHINKISRKSKKINTINENLLKPNKSNVSIQMLRKSKTINQHQPTSVKINEKYCKS